MRETAAAVYGRAKFPRQPPGERAGALYSDLLPQDRAHGRAQSHPSSQALASPRVSTGDRSKIGSPLKCAAISNGSAFRSNRRRMRSTIRKSQRASAKRIPAPRPRSGRFRAMLGSCRSTHLKKWCAGSSLAPRFPRPDRPMPQEPQHSIPIQRTAKAEVKQVFVLHLRRGTMGKLSNCVRGPAIDIANGCVEAAHAAETGGRRNLPHGQRSFIDHFLTNCNRRVCITAMGGAPRCCRNSRRRWRAPMPR